MIQTWFKIFFRNSKKNWLNLVINISGLTLGFAGLLIVLLFLRDENSYNDWNESKDNIYRSAHILPSGDVWDVSSAIEGPLYKEAIPEVQDFMMVMGRYSAKVVKYNNKPHFFKKLVISDNKYFNFFPNEFVKGTPKTFAENQNNCAISEKAAEQIFKGEDAIGKALYIDELIVTVTGVFKNEKNSYFEPEIVIQFPERMVNSSWGNYNYQLFSKISAGADIQKIEKIIDQIYIDNKHKQAAERNGISIEEYGEKYGFVTTKLEKLSKVRLYHIAPDAGPEGAGNYQLLMILLSLSVLLIVISCVNFINLTTASASQRAKEVGVKKTLGVLKTSLIGQYILEVLLQGFIAIIIALVLVELALPYFNDFMDKDLSIFDGNVLMTIVLIAILVSILIGSIPAIYLSNFKVIEVLKGNFSRSKKGILVRNAMLALQFLISGFFLIGVLVIYSQINFMVNKDAGFNGEQIVVVKMNERENKYRKYELAKQLLIKHPNIKEVTSSLFVPGEEYVTGTGLEYKDESITVAANISDFNYLNFAEIKIIKGRGFDRKYAQDTIKNIIINEAAAKALGIYDDPLEKKVNLSWKPKGENMNVIGMVKDYHIDGFDSNIYPMMFVSFDSFRFTRRWIENIQMKIKSENITETIAYIENYWKENVEIGYPFEYEFLDKKFAKTYEKYKKQQSMFLILSIIVILISLLGLFALATLTIQQRLKEVAIRKTLGASVKEIVIQLVKSFLKITSIALLFLLPISFYFMQNWLDNFVYRIDMPIWPYIVAPIILLILVFSVVGIKAFNATKVDLIKYLKFE